MEKPLKTSISGSFEFKPEIDALHEKFADFNVSVLEPSRGWLYLPSLLPHRAKEFRPLPVERGLDAKAIEDRFLDAIRLSDFLYIYNAEQYFGVSVALELGFAAAGGTPIFTKEPLTLQNFEYDLGLYNFMNAISIVATPEEAVAHMRDGTFLRYGTADEMRAKGFDVDAAYAEHVRQSLSGN